MKIGINGRFLVATRTGVQRAAFNLIKSLFELDRENEYFIFTGENQVGLKEWDYANVTVVPSYLKEAESFRNHIWEQWSLPRLAKKHQIDILHCPANMAPLFYSGKCIVHIHDLCFVVNPQWYSFQFRTLYKALIPQLAKRATKVTTNSNNSKNDLMQFCDIKAGKVGLIYWAVDDIFLNSSECNDESHISESDRNFFKSDYFLYVGSLAPRKNIRTLVKAYEIFRDKNPDSKAKLVLIGGESPLLGSVKLKINKYESDIVIRGFVTDEVLSAYYRNATMMVYPSLYEGFGLPPLEAMAAGTPVVTSNTSSIPEVVGEAALMVSPYDVVKLAGIMDRIYKDPSLRKWMISQGLKQVRKYTWPRVARNTLSTYFEVHNTDTKNDATKIIPFKKWRQLLSLSKG